MSNPFEGLSESRQSELEAKCERYFEAVRADDTVALAELWALADREPDWRRVIRWASAGWFGRDR